MGISEKEIELIVKKVLENVSKNPSNTEMLPIQTAPNKGDFGVFEKMEDAILSAVKAQKEFVKNFNLSERENIISAIRSSLIPQAETISKMVFEETKLGVYEDKIQKHLLVITKTPGTECLKPEVYSGDDGLTLVESAPFGVIASITPVTNPTETIINNTISMLSGGNSVVYNVHPSAKYCCAYVVRFINKIIVQNGGPENLLTMVKEPTMDTIKIMTNCPHVRLMVGTGGMQMVKSLLSSGKKTVGAGAGNPPVIVDETADIKDAAEKIYFGASFDNNILCLAEKEVFVINSVAESFIAHMQNSGAYLLTDSELKQITELVLYKDDKGYHVQKEWVGKDASKMLEKIGITNKNTKLLICDVDENNPFVLLEQLMPILPIVRCNNLTDAIEFAKKAEHGNRHTASMFSKNMDNLTLFAKEIETTIFVKNSFTLAGVGYKGEGFSTMTIAGPTGEGVTCAKTFTRQRRCALADGNFRII